jgi:hypothetical protein
MPVRHGRKALPESIEQEFSKLNEDIERTSRLIGTQLQSIDSSLLSAFISLVISSFLSKQFGLLLYWIPTSFILMWILLVFSGGISFFRGKRLTPEARQGEHNTKFGSDRFWFLLLIAFKNEASLFKSIGIIFFISFLSIVLKEMTIIGQDTEFPGLIPVIACLLFMSLPLLNNKVIGELERNRAALSKLNLNRLQWSNMVFNGFFYVASLFILPIWSLVELRHIYGLSVVLPMMLVSFLQVVTVITFMNYFSAMSAKKEMTQAMLRLSRLQQQIQDYVVNQKCSREKHTLTKGLLLESKPYELSCDD